MSLENWSRPYFAEGGHKPQLFYAVFGDIEVKAEFDAYASDLAASLSCRLVEAATLCDGPSWENLGAENPALAEVVNRCAKAVLVEGQVQWSQTLDYLKAAIDFLSYLTDIGGQVVYDPHTLSWFSSEVWNKTHTDGQLFSPFDHTVLLKSPEADGASWLRTRGLIKFGRPDLSVHGVLDSEEATVKKMLDRFITFQALGGVIEEGRPVKMDGLQRDYRPGPVEGDLEDPDFNNVHVELIS